MSEAHLQNWSANVFDLESISLVIREAIMNLSQQPDERREIGRKNENL